MEQDGRKIEIHKKRRKNNDFSLTWHIATLIQVRVNSVPLTSGTSLYYFTYLFTHIAHPFLSSYAFESQLFSFRVFRPLSLSFPSSSHLPWHQNLAFIKLAYFNPFISSFFSTEVKLTFLLFFYLRNEFKKKIYIKE